MIQTYTLPYLRIISENLDSNQKIYLVTFEKKRLSLNTDEVDKARNELSKHNIVWLNFNYRKPGLSNYVGLIGKIISLYFLLFRKGISHIHTFCTPPGALGYILSLFSGRKLILDSFEPHAENMEEIGHWDRKSFKFRMLTWLENRQIRKAKQVICTTQGMYDYAKEKYNYQIPQNIFHVKPACVDLDLFQPVSDEMKFKGKEDLGLAQDIVLAVYAGKLGGIYHDIEIFEFLKEAHNFWEGNFKFLMLTNTSREDINEFCKGVDLDPSVVISKFVTHAEVPHYLGLGDFGITPVKSVPTKRYCTPIKDGEYWALGLPVAITPNISDDSEIIEQNNIGSIFPTLDENGYRKVLNEINELLSKDKDELTKKIREISIKYRSFDIAKNIYRKVYGSQNFQKSA